MEANDYLIVGLGNPGAQYRLNRHNIGFQIVDELSKKWGHPQFIEKWQAYSAAFHSWVKRFISSNLLPS